MQIHLIGSFVFIFSAVVCIFQQFFLKPYRKQINRRGLSGCEAARALLDSHGMAQTVIDFAGRAAQPREGETKKLFLPRPLYDGTSLYAMARSGHEAVLMIESPIVFLPLKDRWRLVAFFSWAGWICSLAGLYRPLAVLGFLGSFFFSVSFLAAVLFVPHEWEIAERAYDLLKKTGCFEVDELMKIRNILRGIRLESLALILKAPFEPLFKVMGK